jgi:hypothetical protein
MIVITSPEQFKNAAKKSRQVKPVVEMVKFGQYCVWGQGGDYTVRFGKDSQGRFTGECNCKAHQNNRICYHLCSSYQVHAIQAGIRKQVRTYEASLVPSISDWSSDKEAA